MNPARLNLRRSLLLVFISRLLAICAIWLVSGLQAFFSADTITYVGPARALIHGAFATEGRPEIIRTPGYPLLLTVAVLFKNYPIIAVLENVVLGVLSAWLIWKIVMKIFPDSGAATWAVVFYCFEPLGITYCAEIMSDTLFSTQMLLFLLIFLRWLRHQQFTDLAISGLLLGAATYTRPISIYLGCWLLPYLLLYPRPQKLSRRFGNAICFPVILVLTLAPWMVRNVKAAGYPGFSAISDLSLYFYSAPAIQARLEHKGFSEAQASLGYNNEALYMDLHPEQRTWPQARIFRFEGKEAKRILSGHWISYAIIHLKGSLIMLLRPGALEMMNKFGLYPSSDADQISSRIVDHGAIQSALWIVVHYPVAGIGFILLGLQLIAYYTAALMGLQKLPASIVTLLFFLFSYFALVSGGPVGVARLRLPIMPLVCISAGVGMIKRKPAIAQIQSGVPQ